MNTGKAISRLFLDEDQRPSSSDQLDLDNGPVKPAQLFGYPLFQNTQLTAADGSYSTSHSPTIDIKHSLSWPPLDETQLLPSSQVQLDGTQVELAQSFGSICPEIVSYSNNENFLIFPYPLENSQVYPDGAQVELSQPFGFRSIDSKIVSFCNNDDLLVFPYTSELSTSGVNGPRGPLARSITPLLSSATYSWESIPDYVAAKLISEGHETCPSQPLVAPRGPSHSLAFAPQAEIPSSSYQILEPSGRDGLGTSDLVPQSNMADSSETPSFAVNDGHSPHVSPCVSSLSPNSVASNSAKMTIGSAGPPLRRKSQVDRTDHEAIQSGTAKTCLQCNDSFKSVSELGRHATELQHDAFRCKCGQSFKRLDSLERHRVNYEPGARQYTCQLCDRYEGEKAFTREDSLKQHLRFYHRVNSTKYGEYKKRYLKA